MNTTLFENQREKIPPQSKIEEFFDSLHFPEYAETPFHLSELVDAAKDFFDIPYEAASLKLADYGFSGHGNTGTFLECLVIWGVLNLEESKKVKKVGPNQWAHISSPFAPYSLPSVSRKKVGHAIASVKILKYINQGPEQIRQGLQHKWSPAVLSLAIKRVFSEKNELTSHLTSGSI